VGARCAVRALEDDDAPVSCDECVDAATIAAMAVAWAEVRATGRCRAAEEIFQPCRADRDQAIAALRTERVAGRTVPRGMREDDLMSPDLRAMARAAYDAVLAASRLTADAMRSLYDLSCAVAAWNGLEFVARQRRHDLALAPVDRDRILWIVRALGEATEFDVLLWRDGRCVRVQATADAHALLVASTWTSEDEAAAAVRAAIHPRRACKVVDVEELRLREVRIDAPSLDAL
jgi:hypothetical protein